MTYKPVSKRYELEFKDYPGLTVMARSASIGQIRKAQEMNLSTKHEDEEKQLEAFKFFEKKLISWNVVHPELEEPTEEGTCPLCGLKEDEPLPPTLKGMECLEIGMMVAIMFGWIQTVARVSVPKEMNSNSGGMNIPEDLTMRLEKLTNPVTLPMPNLSLE